MKSAIELRDEYFIYLDEIWDIWQDINYIDVEEVLKEYGEEYTSETLAELLSLIKEDQCEYQRVAREDLIIDLECEIKEFLEEHSESLTNVDIGKVLINIANSYLNE